MAALLDLLRRFVLEVLVDDVLQAGAVRLDVALQLCVIQGTDLIVVKLLVKLQTPTHTHTISQEEHQTSQAQEAPLPSQREIGLVWFFAHVASI